MYKRQILIKLRNTVIVPLFLYIYSPPEFMLHMRPDTWFLSQSRRLPLLQVVSNNKSFSVGVQSPTEINAPRECAVILRRICQLSLTRITHQVSRAFDLNSCGNCLVKHMVNENWKRAVPLKDSMCLYRTKYVVKEPKSRNMIPWIPGIDRKKKKR